ESDRQQRSAVRPAGRLDCAQIQQRAGFGDSSRMRAQTRRYGPFLLTVLQDGLARRVGARRSRASLRINWILDWCPESIAPAGVVFYRPWRCGKGGGYGSVPAVLDRGGNRTGDLRILQHREGTGDRVRRRDLAGDASLRPEVRRERSWYS